MKKVDARNSGASGKRLDKGLSSSSRQLSVRKDTAAKLPSAPKTAKSSSAKALPAAKKADADIVTSDFIFNGNVRGYGLYVQSCN